MDFCIFFIILNIFTFSFASSIPGENQGQHITSSDIIGINKDLLQRLEANDNLIQQLLGRVDYLETRERDHQTEILQLRKQLRDQEQRSTYLEHLLRRKECTICTKKKKLMESKFDNEKDTNDNKAKTARNSKGDRINRIRRERNPEDPIAFFAAITNHVTHAGVNQTFVFDHAITNIGSAYNSHNGNFVAPVDGVYVFSVTLMSLYHFNAHAKFFRNGQPVSTLYVSGGEAGYDTTSQTIILQLNKGDDVSIHNIDSNISMAGGHYSTFGGFLLQESVPASVVVGRK